ncbi:hypothetical protein [Burkholderia gladioli]|uniref:hypothetical protein n=1 Tax=Burkholderia gladioli TaxID=28095 RepID=UPI003019A8D6
MTTPFEMMGKGSIRDLAHQASERSFHKSWNDRSGVSSMASSNRVRRRAGIREGAVDQEGKNRRGGSQRAASGQRGEETEDLPARRAKPARNGSSETRR